MSSTQPVGNPPSIAGRPEDWDDGDSDEEVPQGPYPQDHFSKDPETVMQLVRKNNALLMVMMEYPRMNHSNPIASPKPLFNAADFVRRTLTDYIHPLLPRHAWCKSQQVANPFIWVYDDDTPFPMGQEICDDLSLWPERDDKFSEKCLDAWLRTKTIAMTIIDKPQGSLMLQGDFDWEERTREGGITVAEIARMIMN